MFVFEAAFVFSLNTMYLVFGHRYQKCIQMVGLTTCPRFHLDYRKAIFSCFCMLDHMLNFLDLQKTFKNYQSILFSFSSHSFLIQFTLRMTIATSLSSHSFVIDFSITTEKEEQEQPSLLQSTTPKQKSKSCFIQTPKLQFPIG